MLKLKVSFFVTVVFIFYSCGLDDSCENVKTLIDFEVSKQYLNNEFEVYYETEDYNILISNDSLKYSIKSVEIGHPDDIFLYKKNAEDSKDSLYFVTNNLGDLEIEYTYYICGVKPFIPSIIINDKNIIVRGKTLMDAWIYCKDDKLILAPKFHSSCHKYQYKMKLNKRQLANKEFVVFEPQKLKSYLIKIGN